jgi:hypothetical protein
MWKGQPLARKSSAQLNWDLLINFDSSQADFKGAGP